MRSLEMLSRRQQAWPFSSVKTAKTKSRLKKIIAPTQGDRNTWGIYRVNKKHFRRPKETKWARKHRRKEISESWNVNWRRRRGMLEQRVHIWFKNYFSLCPGSTTAARPTRYESVTSEFILRLNHSIFDAQAYISICVAFITSSGVIWVVALVRPGH